MPSGAETGAGRTAAEYRRIGIPARHVGATLAGYVAATDSQRDALDAATRLRDGAIDGIALLGPPGVGKSHLLAAACAGIADVAAAAFGDRIGAYEAASLAAAERLEAWRARPPGDRGTPPAPGPGYPAYATLPRWCNVPSLIVDIRGEMSTMTSEHADRARRLRSHPALVVLDDLGRERMSEWTGELVYAIVNERYEQMLPTAVASNLTPGELRDSGYWPAISRIGEGGRLVTIDGADHRLDRSGRVSRDSAPPSATERVR